VDVDVDVKDDVDVKNDVRETKPRRFNAPTQDTYNATQRANVCPKEIP
jgi:hypothetical protein